MARVVLAMSGGVDSSVAAWLLRQQGHEVIGLFMRHGETPSSQTCCSSSSDDARTLPVVTPPRARKQGCCTAADAADASRVADQLRIPFYAIDFQEEFHQIIDYFVRQYAAARTPNPCIVCNNWLKFGRLFDFADSVGAQYVATGHYARIEEARSVASGPALRRGVDEGKDQSYVLFGIDRSRLDRLMFPVGTYRKDAIRRIAARNGMVVAEKKDSQEICFVGGGSYDQFVRQHTPGRDSTGLIVDSRGTVLGRHSGIERFTIGQRKGLGVAVGQPRYVVRIEADTRRVVVGTRDELQRRHLEATDTNWLVAPPRTPMRCSVQIRYNSIPEPATIEMVGQRRLRVEFDSPCIGVAPGQAAVCYAGDRLLGGGWID